MANPYRIETYNYGGEARKRPLRRLDTWGPMDDSRGRAMQSYLDPLPDLVDVPSSINDYKVGSIPSTQQCVDVLKRWLTFHDLDDDQKKDFVWLTLSHLAKKKPLDNDDELVTWRNSLPEEEVVDFEAIKFEIYKVLRLGGGASSREAHSRLYTRTTRSCNIFLRYQSFKDNVHPDEDGDVKLDYKDLLEGTLNYGGRGRRGSHVEVSSDSPNTYCPNKSVAFNIV